MDEPTSGLDTAGALTVLTCARRIADSGRAVLCTVHQPSAELFTLFDTVLLLHDGRVCYFGATGEGPQQLSGYFTRHGAAGFAATDGAAGRNPADLLLAAVGGGIRRKGGTDWAQLWDASPEAATLRDEVEMARHYHDDSDVEGGGGGAEKADGATSASVTRRLTELLRRNGLTYWRTPTYNLQRVVFTLCVSLLVGTSFFQLGTAQGDLRGYVTVIYFTGMMGLINAMSAITPLMQERPVFYREAAAGAYRPWQYAVAIAVTEVPFYAFTALLWVNVTFWLSGFPAGSYVFFLGCYLVFASFMIYFGQAAAALCPTEMAANILIPFLQLLWNLHSGFVILKSDIPVYFRVFHIVNPMAYFLAAMVSNVLHLRGQFHCAAGEAVDLGPCPAGGMCPDATPCATGERCSVCPVTSGDQYLDRFGWPYDDRYTQLGHLAAATGVAIALTVVCIVWRKHIIR